LRVRVPEVDIQRAGITAISVGQVGIGPIRIGELVLDNADFTMSAGLAVLEDVDVTVTLAISLRWEIHINLPWPIPDIDLGDTIDLGSPSFSMSVGNVTIPGLNDVRVRIPTLTASNTSAAISPLTNLQLGSAVAEQIRAHNVAVPAQEFTVVGLGLNSVQGSGIGLPSANVEDATVGSVRGDPVTIGEIAVGSLALPAASIPEITSRAPLDIPADLDPRSFRMDAGILVLTLTITPSSRSHVERLRITNANASASVDRIAVRNVVFPYEVLNLTLSQVGIETIQIPAFAVS
jgi:hypothetical protein